MQVPTWFTIFAVSSTILQETLFNLVTQSLQLEHVQLCALTREIETKMNSTEINKTIFLCIFHTPLPTKLIIQVKS
jgi:hypothetical protein